MALTSVYDAIGQRTQLQCWRGFQTWGYDALHRSRTLVDIEGGLYTWSYEPHGRLHELDYPNGVIFLATYGPAEWPVQGSYCSGADPQIEQVSYDSVDSAGNPLRISDYWGGILQNRRNLTYDAANQMTSWQDSDTRGPVTVFDPAGNPATAQVNNGAYVYTYTYDGADECVNQAETQPGDVFFTSATFSYDGAGQRVGEQYYQLSATNGPSIGLTTYTWDAPGHLLKIQQTNTGAVNLTNSYRPDGLRHQRTDNNGTTQMIWDGDDVLAQVDLSGNLIEAWSWAPPLPGANWSRLVKNRFPTTNAHPDQYVHSDWRGSVVALSLPGGTALANSRGTTPRPWGDQESATLAPLSWLGSHGYWSEYQLGRPMHYVRARWYIDGGWLSPDPLGLGGGDVNLYRYVGNRPTVLVDPSGLLTVDPLCGGFVTPYNNHVYTRIKDNNFDPQVCKRRGAARAATLKQIVNRLCGSGGILRTLSSPKQWQDIWNCALRNMPRGLPSLGFGPDNNPANLQACMTGYCDFAYRITCRDSYMSASCSRVPYLGGHACAYSQCLTRPRATDPFNASDIVVCVNNALPGVIEDKPGLGGWDVTACTNRLCPLVANDYQGTDTILHEMAHSCGACSGDPQYEAWADAVACCILGRFQ